MIKKVILLALLGVTQAQFASSDLAAIPEKAPVADQTKPLLTLIDTAKFDLAAEKILKKVDLESVELRIKDQLRQDITETKFNYILEREIKKQVKKIVADQDKVNKEWAGLADFRSKQYDVLNKLLVQQKLASIMKGLQSGDLENMFIKPDEEDEDQESALQNINVNFDVKSGKIKLTSAATNTEGKSLYGYDLDTQTGAI